MKDEVVGFCRAGAGAGLFVLVTRLKGPKAYLDYFDLTFSGAIESEDIFPGDVIAVDAEDEENTRFMQSLRIEEVPHAWNHRVRDSLFGSGPPSDQPIDPWDGTGRFAGAEPLARRIQMIAEHSTERARVFATASSMDAETIAEKVQAERKLFDSLSLFLSASGLSLSIVASAHPSGDVAEPWREYGQ
ncbi:hypothetical protein [Microbacterium sp. PMB16]|uniref:hypothetical protein n=1 Tax=Microbacterium sp. PMB16 TaxID=3120157 RepID=UPI003F4CA8EE